MRLLFGPAPDAPALALAGRAAMLGAAARARAAGLPRSRALAAALLAAGLGRASAAEKEWMTRIESRKRELAALEATRTPAELGAWDMGRAVRWMSVPPHVGALLVALVRELAPRSIFELGTGFGISAAYQGAALELGRRGRLVSVELDPRRAAVAREGLAALGLERVEIEAGTGAMEAALSRAAPIDIAFVDSDHREGPTLAAFEALVPHLDPHAVVVLDDVGALWAGTGRAWRRLATAPGVRAAVRAGRLGFFLTGPAPAGRGSEGPR